MIGMCAVAEIQAEDVGPGVEQRADRRRRRACRPQGGDDLCLAVASHDSTDRRVRPGDHIPCKSEPNCPVHYTSNRRWDQKVYPASASTRIARKSLTLVRVGPVTIRSPRAAKNP